MIAHLLLLPQKEQAKEGALPATQPAKGKEVSGKEYSTSMKRTSPPALPF